MSCSRLKGWLDILETVAFKKRAVLKRNVNQRCTCKELLLWLQLWQIVP